ncbi:MAG: hypothetical protein M3419_08620 [Actinomycetota bacterium]|nr:hypothetical protein [Actinomycetota bacterium]
MSRHPVSQDHWRTLDDPQAQPAAVDAAAREAGADPDDVRRAAGLTSWLVRRATLDGSTALPAPALARALAGYGFRDPVPGVRLADDQARIVALPEERLAAPVDVAAHEETVADELARLLDGGMQDQVRIVLDVGPASTRRWVEDLERQVETAGGRLARAVAERAAASAGVLASADVAVIDGAHRLTLADAATVLTRLGDQQRLVLVGDPDAVMASAPGRLLADVVDSGVVPVVRIAPDSSGTGPLVDLLGALRRGELPRVDPEQREVVVVPVQDPVQVVSRTRQLVETSIPRAFALDPASIAVLTVRADGDLGSDAFARVLAGSDVQVCTVAQLAGRRHDAIVLVVAHEAAPALTRSTLVSAAAAARRHLSIVHQAGPALAAAVAGRPHAPRLTRLRGLLREAVLGPDDVEPVGGSDETWQAGR